MHISFDGGTTKYDVLPGTLEINDDHDDRGGGSMPQARGGFGNSGSVQILVGATETTDAGTGVTDCITEAHAMALRSGVGNGAADVYVDDVHKAELAVVNVSIGGDAVKIATVEWVGSVPTA